MPGLSLVRGALPPERVLASALDAVCFTAEYDSLRYGPDDETVVGVTKYGSYPVLKVENDEVVAFLEGFLYDVEDEWAHLHETAPALVADERTRREWVRERDGEFLLVVYEKASGEVHVFNDAFGRLPAYCAELDDTVVVSRELEFVRELACHAGSAAPVDRLAVGQYLLFGAPLGTRTLYESVRRVPPASHVRVRDGASRERLFEFDFENPSHADRNLGENADRLRSLFEDACANRRLPGFSTVVSLDGRPSSHLAAAGYRSAGVPASATTLRSPTGSDRAAVRVAKRVAELLDVDWRSRSTELSEIARERTLEAKQGMASVEVAPVIEFFRRMGDGYGWTTWVTDTGGDAALAEVAPRRFSSERELVAYVLRTAGELDLDEAAELANVAPGTLADSLRGRIDSYPETDPTATYRHFVVDQTVTNRLVHADDLKRYHVWTTSPYCSAPFFRYAANCPCWQKEDGKLYSAVLSETCPGLDAVDATFLEHLPSPRRFVSRLLGGDRPAESATDLDVPDVARESGVRVGRMTAKAATAANSASYDASTAARLYTVASAVSNHLRECGGARVEN